MLTKTRLSWLGHVSRENDGQIPKDMLYGELATVFRLLKVARASPSLQRRKQDLKASYVNLAVQGRIPRIFQAAGANSAHLYRGFPYTDRVSS